ncbi:MAG: tol-pal system protein YbgF [Deltaproteobacteria bacterium]|nr:tol-pal system protein YbgF [Deltaproteobacteria bacterium]
MDSEGRINYPGRDTSNGRSPGYTWAGTVLSFFVAVTLFSGCAGTSERQDHLSARTIELSRDVSDLKMQVKDIQSGQMDNAREMGGSAESIRKRQAELGARLDEIESRLAKTSGKVEVLEHSSKGGGGGEDTSFLGNKVKKLEDDKQDLDKRVTELERALNVNTSSSAVPTQERAMAAAQAPVAAPAMAAPKVIQTVKKPDIPSSLPMPKQAPPQKTAVVAKPQAPKPAAPVALESKDEEAPAESEQAPAKKEAKTPAQAPAPATDEFGQGMQLYEKKDYKSAMAAFRAYLAKNPSDKKAPAAHFYIGESYYNQNKYEESILEYQKVIKDHPKSPKTPDALYKQAMSFYSLGDKMSCKLILEKLIKNFPKSNLVTPAKNQLKKIK